MAINLYAGRPNGAFAKRTATPEIMGFTGSNCEIIYELGSTLKSWVPGRAINPLNTITKGASYYIITKINLDMSNYFAPPVNAGIWLTDEGCVSDADLSAGSVTFGTDNTAAIQAVLNRAQTGPLYVIWDGKFSVSDTLRLYSNTTIFFLPGCGVICRENVNKQVFMNANPSIGAITDNNIALIGENWTINGNGSGQQHHTTTVGWVNPVKFIGVNNIAVKGCKIIEPRTFHIWFQNCNYLDLENLYLDYSPSTNDLSVYGNFDGVHINGPSRYISIRNVTARVFDDVIALNADDIWQSSNPTGIANGQSSYDPYASYGDIRDVNIDNVSFLDGALFGFRLLSAASAIKNVAIRNVKGKTSMQLAIIDGWQEGAPAHPGPGNMENIVFENISAEVGTNSGAYQYKNCYFSLGCVIKNIMFKNITRLNFDQPGYPTFNIDANANIKDLVIDGLLHDNGSSAPFIKVAGTVETMTVKNARTINMATPRLMPLVETAAGANIGRLIFDNVNVDNIAHVLNYADGAVDYVSATNIVHTNPATSEGSFHVATGKTLNDLVLSNYYGEDQVSGGGTITGQRGDGFGALPTA